MWSIVVQEPNGDAWHILVDGQESNVRRMYEDYKKDPVNKDNRVTLVKEDGDPGLN
jgi:hypothetical protein